MKGARLSVGFVSPFPPVRSGIADYSKELLAPLGRLVDAVPYPPSEARRALHAGHDVLLFQIGNDPLHVRSVEALADPARKTPAVVVLHDFSLHHLFAAAYLDGRREREYARELVRAHGERGRLLAERNLTEPRVPVWDLDPWSYPMSTGVVADASAVIVHSRIVRGAVLRERPRTHVVEIPHHVVPASRMPREEARRALGLPPDRPVAITLGVVTPAKRVAKILEALASLPRERRPFLFVGGAVGPGDPLHERVRASGLDEDVAFGGYLSEDDFWRAASAADLAVNLRHPTVGETSGAVCRLAGFGLPILVSDAGWFRELPDSFASKIPVGEGETERLAEELSRIAFGADERRSRSAAAVAWGAVRHPSRVAEAYLEVLSDVVSGVAAPLSVSGFLAAELAAVGIARAGRLGAASREPDGAVVSSLAHAAAGLLPSRTGGVRF